MPVRAAACRVESESSRHDLAFVPGAKTGVTVAQAIPLGGSVLRKGKISPVLGDDESPGALQLMDELDDQPPASADTRVFRWATWSHGS